MLRHGLLFWALFMGASAGQAMTPAEHIIYKVHEWQQQQPENTALQQLHGQVEVISLGYQHGTQVDSSSSSSSTVQQACPICLEDAPKASLPTSCDHVMCEDCQLSYLEVHKGAPSALQCWENGCPGHISLSDLGAYLRCHQREDLYIAILKYLVRSTVIGAEFCPTCGESFTLHTPERGHSATCTRCQETSCFKCGEPPHGEIACDQLENNQASLLLTVRAIANGKDADAFGFCPHCEVFTEHKDGCSSMTCGQNFFTKTRIPFTAGRAGCGWPFQWGERITIDKYLRKYDPEWHTRNQKSINTPLMGQKLTRTDLQARLAAGHTIEGADLRGISLEGLDLKTLKLTACLLDHDQVRYLLDHKGDITGANLTLTVDLDKLLLDNQPLFGTRLTGQQLQALYHAGRRNFKGVDLKGMNLQGANLEGVSLRSAKLQGVNFQGVNLKNSDLQNVRLEDADLQGTDLRWSKLQGANLQGAHFQNANLYGAHLQWSNLQGANLRGANLQQAGLQGTKLKGVELAWGSLLCAYLRQAYLEWVYP